MFDEFQKPLPPAERPYIGLRMLAVSGAGLLLSFGLCGVGFALSSHQGAGIGAFSMLGFGLFLLSLVMIVVSVIVLVIEMIVRR